MSVPRSTVIQQTDLASHRRRDIDDGKSAAARTTESRRAPTDATRGGCAASARPSMPSG